LTVRAGADLDLVRGVLVKGSEGDTALPAVVLDILELGEHASPAGNDTCDTDKGVEVNMPEAPEGVRGDEVGDAHMDVAVDVVIVLEKLQHDVLGELVKDFQSFGRGIEDIEGQHWI